MECSHFVCVLNIQPAKIYICDTSPEHTNVNLLGAPALDVCLLIAMKQFEEARIEQYNFEMVFNKFKEFARSDFMSVPKPVAMKVSKNECSWQPACSTLY